MDNELSNDWTDDTRIGITVQGRNAAGRPDPKARRRGARVYAISTAGRAALAAAPACCDCGEGASSGPVCARCDDALFSGAR